VVLLTLWGLVLTAVVTNATVMATVVVPFSRWQGSVAAWYLDVRSLPVGVVPSCSGLDAMSLCVAAILAFPRTWLQRLAGAAIGLVLLLVVNLARIGSLAASVDSAWFDVLHIFVWPAVLVVTTAAWVYMWMRFTSENTDTPMLGVMPTRFAAWAAICLGVYIVVIPVLASIQVLDLFARDLAAIAVSVLGGIGVAAAVQGNLLVAGSSAYLVTSECVTTPLMALYVAGVAAAPMRASARLLWVLAFLPVFVTLAVLRLLTVALPPVLFGSPLFVTHAFHQIVLAMLVVAAMAIRWRAGRQPAALAGVVVGAIGLAVMVVVVAGAPYTRAIIDGLTWAGVRGVESFSAPGAADLQGALTSLPAFQVALFIALAAVVWHRLSGRRALAGVAVLVAVQCLTLAVLASVDVDPANNAAALALRAWAILVPGLVIMGMLRRTAEWQD
jgi:exosortase/archaeosortase family protein